MVEREKKKLRETSTETLKPLTRCVCQGHGGCHRCLGLPSTLWEALISSHVVSAGATDSIHLRTNSCRGPQHRRQAQQVSVLNSCRINTPFLSPSFGSQTFRTKAAPDHLFLLQPLHRRVTLSQHVPDTSVSFSYRWTVLLSGYLQKYHLGLCIHTPSSSVLTSYT